MKIKVLTISVFALTIICFLLIINQMRRIIMLNYSFTKRIKPPYALSVTFKPELKFLSAYLFHICDRKSYEWVKEGINRVINREVEFVERDVEWYGAKIQPETTLIYPTLEGDNPEVDVIRTIDFDTILTVWFDEKERYDIFKKGIIEQE